MTAKDQTIAPDSLAEIFPPTKFKTVPDCRTCVCYYKDAVGPACLKNGCTNGDKYQQEPKVVLWRTE